MAYKKKKPCRYLKLLGRTLPLYSPIISFIKHKNEAVAETRAIFRGHKGCTSGKLKTVGPFSAISFIGSKDPFLVVYATECTTITGFEPPRFDYLGHSKIKHRAMTCFSLYLYGER